VSEYKSDADRALERERRELLSLFRKQEELSIQIAKKQRRVAALATLVDDSEESDKILELDLYGLTNAIRTAIKSAAPRGLTPAEIRTRLMQMQFPVNDYANFRASLNVVLKRLVDREEVKRLALATVESGIRRDESVYLWVQKYGAENSLANTILRRRAKFKGRFKPRFKDKFYRK